MTRHADREDPAVETLISEGEGRLTCNAAARLGDEVLNESVP